MASKKYTDSQLELITDRIMLELEDTFKDSLKQLEYEATGIYANRKGLAEDVNKLEATYVQKEMLEEQIDNLMKSIKSHREALGLDRGWGADCTREEIIRDITKKLKSPIPSRKTITTEILFSEMGDLSTLVETIKNKFKVQ